MVTDGLFHDAQNALGMHGNQAVGRIEVVLLIVCVGCCHELSVHRSQRRLRLSREGLIAAHTDLVLGCEGKILFDLRGDALDEGQLLLIFVGGIAPGHAGDGDPDRSGQRLLKRPGRDLIRSGKRLHHRRGGLLVQHPEFDGLAAIALQCIRPVIVVAHLTLGGQRHRNLLCVAQQPHMEALLPHSGAGKRCGVGVLGKDGNLLNVVELVHIGSAAQQPKIVIGVTAPEERLFGNFL